MSLPPRRALRAAALAALLSAYPGVPVRAGESADPPRLTDAEQAALENNPALKEQYLRLARAQELLLAGARKAKWDERSDVQLLMDRARDKALAESWLESIAAPPPDYPSEDEIKTEWEARKGSFAQPRRHRLAQIYVACPAGADKAAVSKAEAKLASVRKRLAAPDEDFATIARSDSDDSATSAAGGEIGWLSDAQIQPELRAPIVRLRRHEISEAIRLADGWHILKCLDRSEARTPTLDEVRPALIAQLRAGKLKANSEAAVAKLLASPGNPDEQPE